MTSRKIKVAALELPARWADPDSALADASALLARGPACDLALLPEAAITGYLSPLGASDLRPLAERVDGPTTRALAALARAHRTCVAGPLIERDGHRFFNALVVVDAEGRTVARYRKRHPWAPETWATAGEEPMPSFEVSGMRVTAFICFDVHFVADESRTALETSDIALFPSAWVEDGEDDARATLLPTLARRFEVAVVNANWGPGVPCVTGQGGSMVVSREGVIVARAHGAAAHGQRIDAELSGE